MSNPSPQSVIGADLTIEGALSTEGSLSVQGRIEGTITAQSITVERDGAIKGDISAERAAISGSVEGSVVARSVEILEGARVHATIEHELLSVHSGASLLGEIRRPNTSAPTSPKKGTSSPTANPEARRLLSKPAGPLVPME